MTTAGRHAKHRPHLIISAGSRSKAPALEDFRRIAVKVGSSLLVDRAAGGLKRAWAEALGAQRGQVDAAANLVLSLYRRHGLAHQRGKRQPLHDDGKDNDRICRGQDERLLREFRDR